MKELTRRGALGLGLGGLVGLGCDFRPQRHKIVLAPEDPRNDEIVFANEVERFYMRVKDKHIQFVPPDPRILPFSASPVNWYARRSDKLDLPRPLIQPLLDYARQGKPKLLAEVIQILGERRMPETYEVRDFLEKARHDGVLVSRMVTPCCTVDIAELDCANLAVMLGCALELGEQISIADAAGLQAYKEVYGDRPCVKKRIRDKVGVSIERHGYFFEVFAYVTVGAKFEPI